MLNGDLEKEEFGMSYRGMKEILARARRTYGNDKQILVCIEELNELACVLSKYPRYKNEEKATQELFDKALDEVADVYTILEHVKAIFNMSEELIWQRRSVKVGRLNRWLTHSDSIDETIKDRTVTGDTCTTCRRAKTEENYNKYCVHCLKAQATEGTSPYYTIPVEG